jgi:hypothetical protein
MTTPQISSTYHFQADLKGLCLPITFEVPIMPNSSPSGEPLGRSHSTDKGSDIVDPGAATQQPRGVITDTSDINEINSLLSVSKSLYCAYLLSDNVLVVGHWCYWSRQGVEPDADEIPVVLFKRN